jgi:hypothetical protein
MIVVYEKRPESAANAALPRFRRGKVPDDAKRVRWLRIAVGPSANKKAEASKASAVVDFGV